MQQDKEEQLYNIQLLRKYLIQLCDGDIKKADKIIRQNKDNLFGKNGLAYSVGKRSIEFFCLYFLQDTFVPKGSNTARNLSQVHFEIWNELSNMFLHDKFDKLELIMPRGAAKTTVCDFALSVWCHCYKTSIYSLICGKTEQDATEFIRDVRRAFEENEYIKKAFGKLIDSKKFTTNSLELELTNYTKVQAISSTSSMRGKKFAGHRPSLIIADDYQGKNDVITQEARDKKYKTWVEDSQYAGDKAVYRNGKKIKMATKFIVLGTILHRDCFMSRLLKDNSYRHILRRAVLVDDVDKLFNNDLWKQFKDIYFNAKDQYAIEDAKEFYYQHEKDMAFPRLWVDKWDCLDIAIDYYNNPSAFKQEMQNDASKIGEKAFHQCTIKPKEFIEDNNFIKTILCVDPAVEVKSKNDFTAMCLGSKTSNNFRWIRKGLILKVNFDDYINKVIELLKEYDDIQAIWIEKNTYNGTDAREIKLRIEKDDTLKHRHIDIINERQFKNKEAKIRSLQGKVDSGFIIFCEDDREFYEQVMAYEGEGYTLHDDAPDILAEFDRLIDEIEISRPVKLFDKSLLF